MQTTSLSSQGRKLFSSIEFDDNEELIQEIRKHPFGLFIVYLTGLSITLLLFSLMVVGPLLVRSDPLQSGVDFGLVQLGIVIVGFLLSVFALVMTAIGAYLYKANVVLVTSEKIAQVLHKTIFDRKISQLSIGDIQDVTVTQKGIFAHLLNYGTLVIETAGEQQNYTFNYTPMPYESAKSIVGAHERNLTKYGN